MVEHAFNSSTWEAGAGRALWALGQSDIQSEFQDSQHYTERLSQKITK